MSMAIPEPSTEVPRVHRQDTIVFSLPQELGGWDISAAARHGKKRQPSDRNKQLEQEARWRRQCPTHVLCINAKNTFTNSMAQAGPPTTAC